jgi:hypothetical protein
MLVLTWQLKTFHKVFCLPVQYVVIRSNPPLLNIFRRNMTACKPLDGRPRQEEALHTSPFLVGHHKAVPSILAASALH